MIGIVCIVINVMLLLIMLTIHIGREDNTGYYIVVALFVSCIFVNIFASTLLYIEIKEQIKNIAGKTIKEERFVSLPTTKLKEGWNRIYVDGTGSFDIPPTMEPEEG